MNYMKNLIVFVISIAIGVAMLSGCATATNNTSTSENERKDSKEETTEETTTETTTEATTSLTYKTYTFQNVEFKVPADWNYEIDGDSLFFYPDDSDVALEVYYLGCNKSAIENFETAFESMVEGLPGSDYATATINKKVTMNDGNFNIGKVDYTETSFGISTQYYLQLMCDIKTGDFYGFGFSSPDSISEEHTQIVNEVFNSISANYDF
ncbi:MAG: hypothetical protein IJL19_00995 [Clostridiales bacterium]|nr:hypothetical protein [Clostridiales bacterium]